MPDSPATTRVGNFPFAGALVLTSTQSDRLHGLSDLEVDGDGRLMAVSDFGWLWRARLMLDRDRRLTGIDASTIEPLTDLDGHPLRDKAESDAEGLAVLADGSFLVSFEEHHRIWRYPPNLGPPTPMPTPDTAMPFNSGMEALAADPTAGREAYLVGVESTGGVWSCEIAAACQPLRTIERSDTAFGLVALRRASGDRTIALLRAFDERRGNRIWIEIFKGSALVDRLEMAPPMTIDNFEGLAVTEQSGEGLRLYLLSDDNATTRQQTILMAFDWASPSGGLAP
jgi:hypothetical protein